MAEKLPPPSNKKIKVTEAGERFQRAKRGAELIRSISEQLFVSIYPRVSAAGAARRGSSDVVSAGCARLILGRLAAAARGVPLSVRQSLALLPASSGERCRSRCSYGNNLLIAESKIIPKHKLLRMRLKTGRRVPLTLSVGEGGVDSSLCF